MRESGWSFDGNIPTKLLPTILEHLKRAKSLIKEESKWLKKKMVVLYEDEPKFCAIGAIHHADITMTAQYASAALRAGIMIQRPTFGYIGVIPWWNDEPERTHSEVMTAFDDAIRLVNEEIENAGK